MQPNYAPNTVNQTVDFGGNTWKGNPGQGWSLMHPTGGGTQDAQAKVDAQAASDKAATDARFTQGKQDVTDFNTKFSAAVPNIINNTSQKYNLGGLLDQANGLNSRVQDLSGNLTNTGSGGFASSNQVDKAIQTNYLPRYQTAVTNLQTGTGLAQNEENMQLTPLTTEATQLSERLARETTGYTAEQQRELDGLIASINAGVTLTGQQVAQATALAQAEKSYQAAVDQQKLANQNVTLPQGSIYYNPSKGAAGVFNPYQI